MVVLKGIPGILSPELLFALAQMGHGDEIVLADANFPSCSVSAAGPRQIRADGHGIPELLEAILQLLPLDEFVTCPAVLMDLVASHREEGLKTPVWDKYQALLNASHGKKVEMELCERFAFYDRAKKAFAVVATGEKALYGNLILKKGVISSGQ